MSTSTKITRIIMQVVIAAFLFIQTATAQTTLFTEDWETAVIGQTPPAGWGTDVVSGTNLTSFLDMGIHPFCSPFSGSRLVDFESYSASSPSVNRLKRTTPISTTSYPYVSVDFEWYTDDGYPGYTDRVEIQWSTNATTWSTAATVYRYSTLNAWVLESVALPAGAANQPTLYIALLFTSDFGNDCHLDLVHIKGYSTPPSSPTIITTHATNILGTAATLNGFVNANGNSTTGYFQYGLTTSYGKSAYFAGAVTGNTLTAENANIDGLTNSTTYHFRLVGMNSGGITYGNDSVFTTANSNNQPPIVITNNATSVTNTAATLNGHVNPNGTLTTITFQYGLTTSYGTTVSWGSMNGSTMNPVSKSILGLTPSTTYHFRCVGSNTNGTTYGSDSIFTTLAASNPPLVWTTGATSITSSTATLNGIVNANGATTTATFQYGLTASYGSTVTYGFVNGTTDLPVYYPVTGLTTNTLYHYRCVGSSSFGTTNGHDTTFITGAGVAPLVITTHATQVGSTEAYLNGTVNANGSATTVTFQLGLTTSYGTTISNGVVNGSSPEPVQSLASGLTPGTLYHFRCVGVSSFGTTYGNDSVFTTLPITAPYVITTTATNITPTDATLHGLVNPNGSLTTITFEYGLTPSYGTTITNGTLNGNTTYGIWSPVTGLTPATLYHYRCVGVNSMGTTYGNDTVFTTANILAPIVATGGAMSVTSSSSILNGSVNANGSSTNAFFDYGLTSSYGSSVSAGTVTGTNMNPVSAPIGGLQPVTTYHYRAHATNPNGTTYGADSVFTTLPAAPTVNTVNASNVSYTVATLNGTAKANGATATIAFEYGLTTAYGSVKNGTPNTITGNTTQTIYADLTNLLPTATYHYRITGINSIGTTYGADMTFTTDSTINCMAQFSYVADSTDPNTIYFLDESTGNILHWLWNFGDDSSSIAQNPVHTFPGAGNYYVCLAINGPNCINTACMQITIGGSTNCTSYFTFTSSGLTKIFQGQLYNGYPATYSWNFGDGLDGTGQNISHTYAAAGAYYVTLNTVDTTGCSFTMGQTILVGDSAQFHQLFGQVFEGAFPLSSGVVTLFTLDTIPPYMPLINLSYLDSNGVYSFSMVPNGDFYIYAIPTILNGYLPTYFGDVLNWVNAPVIHLGQPNNPYDIHLIPAGSMNSGNGNVYGQVNGSGLKTTFLDKITMLLMDSNGTSIMFNPVTPGGAFSFPSLDYGTYYIKAEMAGVASDLIKVILTPENPNANVTLTFVDNRITGINHLPELINSCIVYPNPVKDVVTISFKTMESATLTFEVISITGNVVQQMEKTVTPGNENIILQTGTLNSGIYSLRITSDKGVILTKKLVKLN